MLRGILTLLAYEILRLKENKKIIEIIFSLLYSDISY